MTTDWAEEKAKELATIRHWMTFPQQLAIALREARIQALEEAAKVADPWSSADDDYGLGRQDAASAIRALKDTQP